MTDLPKHAPDYGPDERQSKVRGPIAEWKRHADGEFVIRNGKRVRLTKVLREAEVLLEDRADIDDPAKNKRTVRGARMRDGLLLMLRRGQLTEKAWQASERFRDDLATAAGARFSLPGEQIRVQVRGRNFEPNSAQVDAITRCKAAWKAVGPMYQPVLSWVVISWGTLGGYADCRRMRPERARTQIDQALAKLVDFYFPPSQPR